MSGAEDGALGRTVMARLDELSRFTDESGRLTRFYLSPAHRSAAGRMKAWMEEAGLTTWIDPVATIVGRLEGERTDAPTFLLGSHIDSVRDAGRYDGTLGVIVAIEAVAELQRRGTRLPFAVEVLAFGDEEGVRFPTTLSGSRAVAGRFDPASLDRRDKDGVSLRDALAAFGCDPDHVEEAARRRGDILAYVEVHIEQGPVLEAHDLPLGVVTAIVGANRACVRVIGEAGHAGTVPMPVRRDALAAAAEMIMAIEARALAESDLVATVGQVLARPGAVNVISGEVCFTLDLRTPDDDRRRRAWAEVTARLADIAQRRGVSLAVEPTHEEPAVTCDPRLIEALSRTLAGQGVEPFLLSSGAGHDAMALAPLCPVGMIFVRCEGGISHNPAESVREADVELAVCALIDFLARFDFEKWR